MKFLGIATICISLLSILRNFKNFILILLSLELFFIGISLLFLDSSLYLDDINGIISSIFILCLSASESAIGLSILLLYSKKFSPNSLI